MNRKSHFTKVIFDSLSFRQSLLGHFVCGKAMFDSLCVGEITFEQLCLRKTHFRVNLLMENLLLSHCVFRKLLSIVFLRAHDLRVTSFNRNAFGRTTVILGAGLGLGLVIATCDQQRSRWTCRGGGGDRWKVGVSGRWG